MTPKISEHQRKEREKQILYAAKRVFERKGFEPTTMKDVVEESGMSRGGVYMYFGSTEELFKGVFALLDKERSNIHEHWKEINEKSAEQILVIFIEMLLQDIQTTDDEIKAFAPVILEYLSTSWRNNERRQYMKSRYEGALQFFEQFFERIIREKELNPLMSATDLAHFTLSFNEGLLLTHHHFSEEDTRLLEQYEALQRSLVHLLQINTEGKKYEGEH
ncbi:TetR family transcriptional regulator [Bacillus tianshenii]|nr:TetR family transcriptional regulator [Bacillus tianshenii]